jgi:hypothetical protein
MAARKTKDDEHAEPRAASPQKKKAKSTAEPPASRVGRVARGAGRRGRR